MTNEELIKVVQQGKTIYGVEKDTGVIHKCRITSITFKKGDRMYTEIELVGEDTPKKVGEMAIFFSKAMAEESIKNKTL